MLLYIEIIQLPVIIVMIIAALLCSLDTQLCHSLNKRIHSLRVLQTFVPSHFP